MRHRLRAASGVDFAEPILERAWVKHAVHDWQGTQADAQTLPGVPDASFAFARLLVRPLTDPQTAFATSARMLWPGGACLIVNGNWAAESLTGQAMRALAERLAPRCADQG